METSASVACPPRGLGSPAPRTRPALRLLHWLLLGWMVGSVAGCGGDGAEIGWLGGDKDKSEGSAVWLTSSSERLSTNALSRLEALGVDEVYLTVARLTDGPQVLERFDVVPPDGSLPTHLVLEGPLGVTPDRAESYADRVAEEARQLRFDLESRGALVVGVHLDVVDVRSLEAYAAFTERLNDRLDKELFLSVTVPRGWEQREGARAVARAADYFVPFLYGQREGEVEDPQAWDFLQLERRLRLLEEWEVPYQLGVVLLGTARLLDASGSVQEETTELSLRTILANRSLELTPGFSLEGVNRRVYEVTPQRPARLGEWTLGRGDVVRVVRSAASDIEELLRLVNAWGLEHHRGQVYFRIAGADEELTLQVESLLSALDDSREAEPDLELEVSLQRRTGRGWLMRFGVANQNGEFSELVVIDNNYLQVRTLDGAINRNNVAAGDFYRFQLYRGDRGGALEKTFRDAEVVRFHVPLIEGEQRISTGDVEILSRDEPAVEVSASFMLPDGRVLTVGPSVWRDGAMQGAAGG